MVVVAGGDSLDSASGWGFRIQGDLTAANIAAPTPLLELKDVFLTGKWKKLYQFSGLTACCTELENQIGFLSKTLNDKVKNYPYASENSYGLYQDLSPSNPDTITIPPVDPSVRYLSFQSAGGRDSLGAPRIYRPLDFDMAIFQSAPLNGRLNISACQSFLDDVEYSSVLQSNILPWGIILSNGDRVYPVLSQSDFKLGPVGVQKIRLKLVLMFRRALYYHT